MYKVIWLTKLNGERGRETSLEHWRTVHAELMTKVPGVERYIQNLWVASLDPSDPSVPEDYNLHSECWFTDQAAYEAAMSSPEWAAVAEDSPKCFDNTGLTGAVVQERVAYDARG